MDCEINIKEYIGDLNLTIQALQRIIADKDKEIDFLTTKLSEFQTDVE